MGQVSPREMLAKAEQLELEKLKPKRIESFNISPVKNIPPKTDTTCKNVKAPTTIQINTNNSISQSIKPTTELPPQEGRKTKRGKVTNVNKRKVQMSTERKLTTETLLAKKDRTTKIDALIRRYRMSDSEDFKIMKSIILRDEKTDKQLTEIKRWMMRMCPFLNKLDDDLLVELANTLNYRSYNFGDEVCNKDMCGIIIEGQVSARVRTRDQVFEEIMTDSQLIYDEIENIISSGEPLVNILGATNVTEKNLIIEGMFKDINLISNAMYCIINNLNNDQPVTSLPDFIYILRRYKVTMSNDEIENIFHVIHAEYVDEEELKRREDEEERAIQLELEKKEQSDKSRQKIAGVSLFNGLDMTAVKGSKKDDSKNNESDDYDDDYDDDDFENEFEDSTEPEDTSNSPVISNENFTKWFTLQSKHAKMLLYAILGELHELYENYLKPADIVNKNNDSMNPKTQQKRMKKNVTDIYDVTRNGFIFIFGEEKLEDANETWEHFFAYCKKEIDQTKFINWCMKFPTHAKSLLDGKRRCSLEHETKELYELLQINQEILINGDPNDVNNIFFLYLTDIVGREIRPNCNLDEFKDWYLSETEEAVNLAYEYTKLKRIWLGQEMFTFFDSSVNGLINKNVLQKAFQRLNINIEHQKLNILMDELGNANVKLNNNLVNNDAVDAEERHIDMISFCKWFCDYKPFSKILIKRASLLLSVKSSAKKLHIMYNLKNENKNETYRRIQTPTIRINARTSTIGSSIFRSIDKSAYGHISIQDLIYTFRKLDYPVKNTLELHKVFSAIDVEGTGLIGENAFVEWFSIGNKYTSFLNVRYLINKIDNDRNPETFLNTGSLVGNRWLSDIGGPNYATYKAAIDGTGVLLIPRSAYDSKLKEQQKRHLHKIEVQLKTDFADLFNQWSKSRLQRLCENGKLEIFKKQGSTIYEEGDVNNAVYFILSGGISLNTKVILRSTTVIPTADRSKTLRNIKDTVKRVHLRKLKRGSYFGETGMIFFQKQANRRVEYEEFRSHNATSTEDNTKIFCINDEEAARLLDSAGAIRTMLKTALFFDKNKVAADYALKRKEKRFLKSSLLMEAPKYAKRRMDAKRKLDKALAEERKRKSKARSSTNKRRLTEQRLTISKSMPNLPSIPHLPVLSPVIDINSLKVTKNKSARHAVLLSDNMPFQHSYQQINFKKAKRWFQGEIPRTRFDPKLSWKEDGTLEVSNNYNRSPKKAFPKMLKFDDDKI